MFYEIPSSWGWESDAYWEDEGREEGESSFLNPKDKKLSPFSDSPSPSVPSSEASPEWWEMDIPF